jgi:uncharacterized protein (TIGR02246 family)
MRQVIVSAFLLVVATIGFVFANDPAKSTAPNSVPAKPPQVVRPEQAGSSTSASQPAHDEIVKQLVKALLAAYVGSDAKALAASFTADGEYIDAKGVVFHGRKAIEDEFESFFHQVPGTSIEIAPVTTRFIAAGVISSDCTIHFKKSETSLPVPGHCQLVCTRDGDKWLIASLHEIDGVVGSPAHHARLSQLDWLVGEWIGEGPRSHVHFSCRWDEGGNFLLRDFRVQTAAGNAVTGTQRIGYDPVSGHLKMWAFDSAGGCSDGYFTRDGDAWVLRTSGVNSDGIVSSTTIALAKVDDHRISSELIDRSLGGQRIGQAEKMILVRKAASSVLRSGHTNRPGN